MKSYGVFDPGSIANLQEVDWLDAATKDSLASKSMEFWDMFGDTAIEEDQGETTKPLVNVDDSGDDYEPDEDKKKSRKNKKEKADKEH